MWMWWRGLSATIARALVRFILDGIHWCTNSLNLPKPPEASNCRNKQIFYLQQCMQQDLIILSVCEPEMRHGITCCRRCKQTEADVLNVAGSRSLKEVSRASSGRGQVRKEQAVMLSVQYVLLSSPSPPIHTDHPEVLLLTQVFILLLGIFGLLPKMHAEYFRSLHLSSSFPLNSYGFSYACCDIY